MPWKSKSENVVGDILLCVLPDIACTDWTTLRCFFLEEDDVPPLANPSKIVLIVLRRGGLSSVRLGCGCVGALCSVFCVLAGSLLGSLCSTLRSTLLSTRLLSLLSYRGLDGPSPISLT